MGVSGSVCDTAEIARRIVGGCSSFGFLSFRVCLGVAGGGFIAGGLRAAGGGVSFPEVLGCAGDLAEGGIIVSSGASFIFCPAVLNATLRDFGRRILEGGDISGMCADFRSRFLDEAFRMPSCPELLQAVSSFARIFPGASDFPLLFSDCGKPSPIKVNLINIKRLTERVMARRGKPSEGASGKPTEGLTGGATEKPDAGAGHLAEAAAGGPGGSCAGEIPTEVFLEKGPGEKAFLSTKRFSPRLPCAGKEEGVPEAPDGGPGATECRTAIETAAAGMPEKACGARGDLLSAGTEGMPSAYADYAKAARSAGMALAVEPEGFRAGGRRKAAPRFESMNEGWLFLETAFWRPADPEPALEEEIVLWGSLPPEEPPYFERTYPATAMEAPEEPMQLYFHLYLMKCADGSVHPLRREEADLLVESYAGDLDEEEVRAELREQSRKTLTQEPGGKFPERSRLMRYLKACLDRRARKKREEAQAAARLENLARRAGRGKGKAANPAKTGAGAAARFGEPATVDRERVEKWRRMREVCHG